MNDHALNYTQFHLLPSHPHSLPLFLHPPTHPLTSLPPSLPPSLPQTRWVASAAGGARFNFDEKKSGFLTGVDSGVTAMRGAAGWCVGMGVWWLGGWDGWWEGCCCVYAYIRTYILIVDKLGRNIYMYLYIHIRMRILCWVQNTHINWDMHMRTGMER